MSQLWTTTKPMPKSKKTTKAETINFHDFDGFDHPKMTDVPDLLIDHFLPYLSGAEVKVILYICRKTFGWKKDSDNISLSQMLRGVKTAQGDYIDRGAGISKPSLLKALRGLVDKNLIIKQRRSSRDKGDEPSNYQLNLRGKESLASGNRAVSGPPRGKRSLPGGGNERSPHPAVNKATSQYNESNNNSNVNVDTNKKIATNRFENPFSADYFDNLRRPNKSENQKTDNDSQVEHLVNEILKVCEDRKSRPFYRQTVKRCPPDMIWRNLAIVAEVKKANQIKKSPGALFTNLIKKDTEEAGIDLGLKRKA